METNKNIGQLLEMLDHPEAYSEQEILDIINRDDETRETYRQLVQAKRVGNLQRSANQPDDVDEAWQRFEAQHLAPQHHERSWFSHVAAILGVIVVSGVALAAVYSLRHMGDSSPKTEVQPPQQDVVVNDEEPVTPVDEMKAAQPVVFDNIPLESILKEIAPYYGVEVEFQRDEARQLRFHFLWNKEDGLEKVLDDLNHFESVVIGQQGNKLIVR